MERLTIKQDGEYYIKTLNDDCIVCASCEKCEKHINQLVKILGAYEDTGLTPEEITSIQKENEELKKEVKLWEQGREAIANQAKLVEKISFENSKKYFEEKAKKDKLAELLKLAIEDMNDGHLCFKCGANCNDKGLDDSQCEFISQCGCFKWQHADKLRGLGVEE